MVSSSCYMPDSIDWDDWIELDDLSSPVNTKILESDVDDSHSNPEALSMEEGYSQVSSTMNQAQSDLTTSTTASQAIQSITSMPQTDFESLTTATPKKDVSMKKDQIQKLQKLRNDLQKGLLIQRNDVEENMMDEMLFSLSTFANLCKPTISIPDTRISELLAKVYNLRNHIHKHHIPFQERVKIILDNLFKILESDENIKESKLKLEESQHFVVDINDPKDTYATEVHLSKALVKGFAKSNELSPVLPQKLVVDLTESDDEESETSSQAKAQHLRPSKLKKRKRSDHLEASPISLQRTKRKRIFKNYLPQENAWMAKTLNWIDEKVNENIGETIIIKRSDLLELKSEVEAWRMEDLNVTERLSG
ncbi:uncharacterized protein EAF01_010147 [Botrytis porri]|uniref:Uncharacterized protein n=1 Tax=Botrytis porri TaxID=87229 RepID=A0A4Z1L291_9HELO|nr:uncharacterized protein EAF01_010147 [Botrytis porri]KAF7894697.1 hypothetical protein EAF01_010147 [Botrytis porri]TGO90905.1 hypothetical protein BPOR_0047g00280 [Botrytis porri]